MVLGMTAVRRYSWLAVALLGLGLSSPANADFTIGNNFTGTTLGVNSNFIPPDSDGAIGSSHFTEMVNGRYSVFNRTNGNRVQTKSLDQFWIDAGAPPTSGTTDPRVIYDHHSGRWFAVTIDTVSTGGNNILVAVSATSDPTGSWSGFKFKGNPASSLFADFPTLGVDRDGVYVSTNNFNGDTFTNVTITSIPKADLTGGTPTVANRTTFEGQNPSTRGFAIQAAVDYGPSDARAALLAVDADVFSRLNRTNILGAGGPGATLSSSVDINVNTTSLAPAARQPDSTQDLDTGDIRFSGAVFEMGNSLWAVHSTAVSGRAALRWYEIDETTNGVIQSGTISDPVFDFFYPSISANQFGEVVIGFSRSGPNSPSGFASAYAVGGTTIGGVTTFGAPVLLAAGVANYHLNDSNNRNRWGDYSATTLDPNDPHSFWTIQEFASATDTWSTQITQVMFNTAALPEPSSLVLVGIFGVGAVVSYCQRRFKAPVAA